MIVPKYPEPEQHKCHAYCCQVGNQCQNATLDKNESVLTNDSVNTFLFCKMDNISYLDELRIRGKYPNLAFEVSRYIDWVCAYALDTYKEKALFYPNKNTVEKISLELSDRLYREVICMLHCYNEPPAFWQILCRNLDTVQPRYIELFIDALP
jgi:hypothetical protein